MKTEYIVYSEDWSKEKKCETLTEARAYRYQQYGYAGYIIARDEDGEEIANYS